MGNFHQLKLMPKATSMSDFKTPGILVFGVLFEIRQPCPLRRETCEFRIGIFLQNTAE